MHTIKNPITIEAPDIALLTLNPLNKIADVINVAEEKNT